MRRADILNQRLLIVFNDFFTPVLFLQRILVLLFGGIRIYIGIISGSSGITSTTT